MNNGFEICVQQYAFTKRCWWQLSSLVQQKGSPHITFKLNIHNKDPFHGLNTRLIKTFSKLIDLKVKVWDNDRFFKRGDVRNDDLKEAKQPWLIYADADMVFDKYFFNKLASIPKHDTKMTIATRHSSSVDDGNKIILSESYINAPIPKSAQKMSVIAAKKSRPVGAGYFQMVNTNYMRNTGLIYAIDGCDRKLSHARGPSYHSDKQLRAILGMHDAIIAPMYHINHFRFRDHGSNVICK